MNRTVPIFSVVGKSDSGKTTLLEKLLGELTRRGYRIATIKHDVHGFNMDTPGKDSWRHAEAGADAVLISSPTRYALIRKVERERTLDQLASLVDDGIDLVITEGYKRGDKPKLEVFRSERNTELLCGENDRLFAVAADRPELLEGSLNVPVFDWDDAPAIADLVERLFLSGSSIASAQNGPGEGEP